MNNTFLHAIDGAEYVFVDYDAERVYIWNGLHTIDIIDAKSGQSVDCISLDYTEEKTTRHDAHESIMERVKGDRTEADD